MEDLTAFQRDALYVIAGEEGIHGLGIKENLEEYYPGDIGAPRLYDNLDSLVEKGLVTKGKRDGRTNTYSLTSLGVEELRDRREWENEFLELLEPELRAE